VGHRTDELSVPENGRAGHADVNMVQQIFKNLQIQSVLLTKLPVLMVK